MISNSKKWIKAVLGKYDGLPFYTTAAITICVVALGSSLTKSSGAARDYLTNLPVQYFLVCDCGRPG